MAATGCRSLCVLDTRCYFHHCGFLIVHEVWIFQMGDVYFHDVLDQCIHLRLISLDFIYVYDLVDLKVLKKFPQIILHKIVPD